MTTAPSRPVEGYVHQAAFYGSDEELVELVVPFLLDGVAAGEPAIAAFGPHEEALLRAEIGPDAGVAFLSGGEPYLRPATALRTYTDRFTELVAAGAPRIRVTGTVPHTGHGACWDEWLRYEVAAASAFAPFPLWGLCPYDTRTAPERVLEDVLATHPFVTAGLERQPNPAFSDPAAVLAALSVPPADPLAEGPPAAALSAPTPAGARAAASQAAASAGLSPRRTEDLLVVASELVTNGILHGAPPVTLEIWTEPGRVLVSVSDAGPGPTDPLVGLLRRDEAVGGMGLWIAHQMADRLVLGRRDGRFAVQASVGTA